MRIIAGNLRGRKLKSPKGNDVRPTSDRVKEAVFSMLQPNMTDGFVALDLFAGSGNIGIEAISRGAKTVYFSDASKESIALVKENVHICGAEDNAVLLLGDYRNNIRRIREKLDIVFMDPPYAAGYIVDAINLLYDEDKVKQGGVVVCEHSYKDALPEDIDGFKLIKDKKYGAIGVSVYERI